MTRMPLVSAVLCTYNRADLLRLMLESLCRQTLATTLFEVVVVDDGSKDGTREVVRAFEPRLPLRYSYQQNAGLASARNHGVFCARGEILLFLDDDDVADPRLLEAHCETHRRFPEDRYGVLGYTGLDTAIAGDPLMHFVTRIGCFLFAYPNIKDGDILDFSYFWGGRSSCKRSFLLEHGVFNPVFRFGCEDIELAFRLSKYGFQVVYSALAITTMIRRVGFDAFCRRLVRQGQSNFVFSQLHQDPAVQQWAEVLDAAKTWPSLRPSYEGILRSARELDRIVRLKAESGFPVEEMDQTLLHRGYWAAFRASKMKGIMEKEAEIRHGVIAGPQGSACRGAAHRCVEATPAQPTPEISKPLATVPGIQAGRKVTWSPSQGTLGFHHAQAGSRADMRIGDALGADRALIGAPSKIPLVRERMGHCPVCGKDTRFVAKQSWLREHYRCESCDSSARERALAMILEARFPRWKRLRIHESSPGGALAARLRAECQQYIATHFWPGVPGGALKAGTRCENLEQQTFPDRCFDLVVTMDVMEHVLDWQAAFREIGRTLAPGGAHVFTTPRYPGLARSEVRARRTQHGIEHLLEPEYHDNPVDPSGALVTVHWGDDIGDLIMQASGLTTTIYLVHDPERGIEGECLDVLVSSTAVAWGTEPQPAVGASSRAHTMM